MFPAPAGMSPISHEENCTIPNVPRTRGDEPGGMGFGKPSGGCSPHPRG